MTTGHVSASLNGDRGADVPDPARVGAHALGQLAEGGGNLGRRWRAVALCSRSWRSTSGDPARGDLDRPGAVGGSPIAVAAALVGPGYKSCRHDAILAAALGCLHQLVHFRHRNVILERSSE